MPIPIEISNYIPPKTTPEEPNDEVNSKKDLPELSQPVLPFEKDGRMPNFVIINGRVHLHRVKIDTHIPQQ